MSTPADVTDRVWRVEVDMPMHGKGRRAGKPVGWLTLNGLPGSLGEKIAQAEVARAWRLASYTAIAAARVPRGLGRVEVQVEFRFVDRTERDIADNYQRTAKPVVDAIGPGRHYWTPVKATRSNPAGRKLVVELGCGVAAGDGPTHMVRPEPVLGPTLPNRGKVRGRIVLHIRALPETPSEVEQP